MRMATTIERRTVTRTVHTEGADQIKANLGRVAEEIARVRDRAREEVTSLEKIKGMLDVGYLNDLITSIEQLDVRMQTLQGEALDAARKVDDARLELAREQERLAKLWEAYKVQEDELNQMRRDGPQWADRLAAGERTIESLRREVTRLEAMSKYKSDYENTARENQTLRIEVENLNRDLLRSQQQMRQWEAELVQLRSEAGSHARVPELQAQLDEERERLAKLYKVYEEQSADLKESTARLERWEAWVQKILPAIETLCRTAPNAPRN
jgi:chromosome segregation ATPase